MKKLDNALLDVVRETFSGVTQGPIYNCEECRDTHWILYKEEENGRTLSYAKKCQCKEKGGWSMKSYGFPDYVGRVLLKSCKGEGLIDASKILRNEKRRCFIITGAPAKVLEAGLSLATSISGSDIETKCVSARTSPESYDTQWNPQVSKFDVVMVIEVDRRLTPSQVQCVSRFVDQSGDQNVVIIGEPIRSWPKTMAWASLGLSLQAKNAVKIEIK